MYLLFLVKFIVYYVIGNFDRWVCRNIIDWFFFIEDFLFWNIKFCFKCFYLKYVYFVGEKNYFCYIDLYRKVVV